MSNKRYIVVEGSLSKHCCFEFTVVDTHAGKEDYGDYWKRAMCETFAKDSADEICNALNSVSCFEVRQNSIYNTGSKHVIFWNAKGELVYSAVDSNNHIGCNIVCYRPNMEAADDYVKRFADYHKKRRNSKS